MRLLGWGAVSVEFQPRSVVVDGLATGYLEAGAGDPVVLLHGGEFGASAELGWECTIAAVAAHYRVLAPDMLGYGNSAKVVDFVDGRGMRIRHVARFCEVMNVESAHFVGNSMGAINLLTDVTSADPVLPVASLTLICGGGEIQRNEHANALFDYDGTVDAMRRIVTALFFDPGYPADDDYVGRATPIEHGTRRVGGDRRRAIPQARCEGGSGAVDDEGLRAHLRADTRRRRGGGQAVAERLGRRHRRPNHRRTLRGGRRRGPLPTDRTAGGRQRSPARLLRRECREMTNELAGKVAIVTGGASGIGRGIVERFLAEGAKVMIADVQDELGAAVAKAGGPGAHFHHADVGDQEQVGDLVAAAVEKFGGLHVMVNNAGRSSPLKKGLFTEDFAEFDSVMRVNVLGVMAGTRDAGRHMAEHGGGAIINISSIGGILAGGGVATYRASKAAVIQFTKSAAIELAQWRSG